MESKLEKLSIQQDKPSIQQARPESKSQEVVAESWEDDAASSDSDTELDEATRPAKSPVPNAPPPTPISPTSPFQSWDSHDSIPLSTGTRDGDDESRRRPEKSTAVAGRLIAAGLGLRAPKKNEEQRAYDKAVRENEIKRRLKEKETKEKEREDAEKARSAIWES
jgi:hypothetical protein